MVSVCIATYNGGKYIKEQIESILIQLSVEDEIIISDDHSTDNTIEIISSFMDPRIKIFIHEKSNNPYKRIFSVIFSISKNIENALQHCSGDYIFLSDQDDIWLPNKVKKIKAEFQNGYELILHDNIVIDNAHNVLLESYFSISRPQNSLFKMVIHNFYLGAAMAFTKNIKQLSLPFPNIPIAHEHWLSFNAYFNNNKIKFIKESLMLYRRHGKNISSCSEKSSNPIRFKIGYRFYLIYTIIVVLFRKKN
jgi:glycosyltransferase involved in cell wall biosynthesis